MLKHLQQFILRDFIEYNVRPYQDYTLSALLNLYTFTSDRHPSGARVKTAAQHGTRLPDGEGRGLEQRFCAFR